MLCLAMWYFIIIYMVAHIYVALIFYLYYTFIFCFVKYKIFAKKCLLFYKICVTLYDIGNDKKQMWFCHQFLRIFVGEVVMFMVKVILFLILSLMFSLTLNVALATVLYKNWVDKQLHK